MPLLLPDPPRLSALEREVFQHIRANVDDASADPEAYFGQDAPDGYADSRDLQVADLLEQIDGASIGGDHRWANAAARLALKLRRHWLGEA